MFKVKDFMTSDVICTESDATISEIIDLMHAKHIHRVPVVQSGKLAGLITEGMISHSGTQTTSLSIYELNYLLSKTTVKSIMIKDVISVHEDDLMEDATERMLKNDIGCLPVINDADEVTGILTQNDVFKCFLNMLGWGQKGSRITIGVKDELGAIGNLSKIFVDKNVNITNLGVYSHSGDVAHIVIRCDAQDPTDLCKALEDAGYQVLEQAVNKE